MTANIAPHPFHVRTASDYGYSPWQLREAVKAGHLRRMFRGVVVRSSSPDSRELRAEALSLVMPTHAVVADHTAAWLYGVDTFPPGMMRDFRPQCLVEHGRTRPAPSRCQVRQTTLPEREAVEIGGVRTTSPVRTTSDLLRLNFRPYAYAAGNAMVRSGLVAQATIAEYVAQQRHLPYLAQAIQLAPNLRPEPESHGESWALCRMLDAALPMPTLQHEVRYGAEVFRLDSAFVEQRVATEFDGKEMHRPPDRQAHDRRRRGLLSDDLAWRFVISTRETVFGADPAFELAIGALLGLPVRPRTW